MKYVWPDDRDPLVIVTFTYDYVHIWANPLKKKPLLYSCVAAVISFQDHQYAEWGDWS